MILDKAAVQNNAVEASQISSRALSLLMDEMAVWYPAPYYDIEAMVSEETKGFKSNRRSKTHASALSAKRSKSNKSLSSINAVSAYA